MTNDSRYIDTADVEELQALLDNYEDAMDVGVLDGYLTASALNPTPVTDEDLIPYIFSESGDPEAVPEDERLLELIGMRRQEITAALCAGAGLDPVILPADEEDGLSREEEIDYALEPWCTGFVMGSQFWGEVAEAPDMVTRLTPVLMHLEPDNFENADELRMLINEAKKAAPKTLEDALYDIVETVFELKKELVPNRPIVKDGPKIGRNDPCPCGSGKKYKQCCGKN